MKNNLVPVDTAREIFQKSGLPCIGNSGIREIKRLAEDLEEASGVHFIHMEMGNPGLPASQIGVEAQIAALRKGVAAHYPDIDGTRELKKEASRFIRNFIDLDVSGNNCLPTVGSMQAAFTSFMICSKTFKDRDTILFIDPCFPVHKYQNKVLGIRVDAFDIYDYRGEKLRAKLEGILAEGRIHSIIYSNPNNPSWVCLTDEELKIIGELATKFDVIVIEDLAYFGMDFRKDYGHPGVAPYQPSVGKYTDNYILLISSSKAFSYAGERVAILAIADKLASRHYPDLLRYFNADTFRSAIIFGGLHTLSSGTSHSAQYALAALFKAANDGTYNFREEVMEYGRKAKLMKKALIDNGFVITYDKDLEEDVADGFYFTFGYPGFTGAALVEELLYYGVSAISLWTCGSTREGLRACTSLIPNEDIPELARRLALFHEDHR
ncbi:MAG: pyridoxal phosphate-dependent aminotransferase [Bacteroidales bacterium]|nr:pyridoxal phosphate-dependent aminotransferase [Bacteroidales bacterium]